MIKIWGRRNSVNVQKALWAAEECGIEFQRENIAGSFGVPDEYSIINPNRVVPPLTDGDLVVWESHSIVRHLASRNGNISGSSPEVRARADMWMDWTLGTFTPPFFQVFFPLIRTPEADRDYASISGGVDRLAHLYRLVDDQLSNRHYLAGDEFTFGDIPLGACTYRYFNLDIQRPALPHVESWYERLQSRPAYKNRVMIPFGSNPEEWLQLEKEGADR